MVKVLSLFSGSLASRVASKLVEQHPQVESIQLLHFRSPFSRDCDELRQFVKSEWGRVTFRTQSIKKDYQDLIALSNDGTFSLERSCRSCQELLFAKAARYLDRTGADYLVTGMIPNCGALASDELERILETEGLTGRVLNPLLMERPLRTPSRLTTWADMSRRARDPEAVRHLVLRLARALGLDESDPLGSTCRCKLMTPGFGERVASLFRGEAVTLNALCLLDFPMYIRVRPDLQIVLAFDETEKRELQNYFLPQDLRIYPATPHGPMTLLRTNWSNKRPSERNEIVTFVARLTATYANVEGATTIPIYYRQESGDERQLINVEPFDSIGELEARAGLELIPLQLPVLSAALA